MQHLVCAQAAGGERSQPEPGMLILKMPMDLLGNATIFRTVLMLGHSIPQMRTLLSHS